MLISLLTPLALAGLNDMTTSNGTPLTIPVMTMVAGGVSLLISKSQAEKQASKFGMSRDGVGVKALTWVIRGGGVGLVGYGLFQFLTY